MTQVPSEKELQVFPIGVEPTTVRLNNTTDALPKQSRLRGGHKGYCPGGVCKRDGGNNCNMFDKEVV